MTLQTPRGTRDLVPEEMEKRNRIIDIIRKTYESYGFLPLETPAFESWELLSKKGGGGDAIKDEIYYFKDKSGRELALRFDLTVPLSRFIATNPQIAKPFKRYQIGRVWRYDRPQAGRFREFEQADIDIIGSASMEADAECIAAVSDVLKSLGLKNFVIRVNNRKILNSMIKSLNLEKKAKDIFRILDKMEKAGENETTEELKKIDKNAVRIMDMIRAGFAKLDKKLEGMNELSQLMEACKRYGLQIKPDLALVRGLDYYTGSIFEISAGGGIGSIAGGGRYDNLIGTLGKQETPAVGISIGIDRLSDVLKPQNAGKKNVFIAMVKEDLRSDVLALATKLRKAGIVAINDVSEKGLRKQLDYVNAYDIPWVVFVGPEEVKTKKYTVRNMKTGKEERLDETKILALLK